MPLPDYRLWKYRPTVMTMLTRADRYQARLFGRQRSCTGNHTTDQRIRLLDHSDRAVTCYPELPDRLSQVTLSSAKEQELPIILKVVVGVDFTVLLARACAF
jgi:hypothetical protein